MKSDLGDVGKFFDGLHDEYTETITRCFPRYCEMQWALLKYLPDEIRRGTREVRSIVDLGCGTGNLAVLLAREFPDADLHLVDVSSESLDVARQRLDDTQATFHTADMREWEFPGGHDLVASSIAIHHIDAREKQSLFSRVHQSLRPGGVFAMADQCAGATDDIYQQHIQLWKDASFAAGASQQEWQMWMQHQTEHDHHETLGDQMQWLQQAGFHGVDCPWRFLLWAVLIGIR